MKQKNKKLNNNKIGYAAFFTIIICAINYLQSSEHFLIETINFALTCIVVGGFAGMIKVNKKQKELGNDK